MEGYTDTIVARQYGFENTVAVLGTALGERHIRLLRRFADSITLVLDGDEAGQRRANEILGLFVAEQVDLRIVTLPDGLDPADFLLTRGADAFRQFLDSAVDALEHKLTRMTQSSVRGRRRIRLIRRSRKCCRRWPRRRDCNRARLLKSRLREHQILSQLSRQFRVSEEELRLRLRDLRRRATPGSTADDGGAESEESPALSPLSAWERELLEIVLLEPEAVIAAAEEIPPEQMDSPVASLIFQRCCELSRGGITPDFRPIAVGVRRSGDQKLAGRSRRTRPGENVGRIGQHQRFGRACRADCAICSTGCAAIDKTISMDEQSQLLREKRLNEAEELAVLNQLIEQETNKARHFFAHGGVRAWPGWPCNSRNLLHRPPECCSRARNGLWREGGIDGPFHHGFECVGGQGQDSRLSHLRSG